MNSAGSWISTIQEPRLIMSLLLAMTVGAVLRCHGITGIELQYDEAATGYFARLPWADLWGGPAMLEPNPPLFYSVARLVMLGGGDIEQIRYVSAAAGTLCIPIAWLIGRLLADRFTAGAAAWVVATSPQNIAFSQYARTYALLTLSLLCVFLCLVFRRRAATERSGLWWWGCYVAVSTASLYFHYTALVILAAINASALVSSLGCGLPGRRFRAGLLVASAVVVFSYLPWLPVLVHQAVPGGHLSATVWSTNLAQRLTTAVRHPFIFRGSPWINGWFVPLVALGALRFRASHDVRMLVISSLGGPMLIFLVSQRHPMLDAKTLGWAGLYLLICTTLGLQAAGQRRWPALAFVLFIQLNADASQAQNIDAGREGWRDVASLLRREAKDGDVVFINDAAAILALRHYNWPEARLTIRILAKPEAEPWFRDAPGIYAAESPAESILAKATRVWVMTYNAPNTHNGMTQLDDSEAMCRLFHHSGRLDISLIVPAGQPTASVPECRSGIMLSRMSRL